MCFEKPKKFYIKPELMRQEYEACMQKDECSEKLLKMFQLIAEHFTSVFYYMNEIDRKTCISFAVTEAWLKWKTYDPTRSNNIFSFFTTMISNDLRQHYKHITKNYHRNISIESLMNSVKK